MKSFVVREGVIDAPYPELKAFRYQGGTRKIAGVKITEIFVKDKDGNDTEETNHSTFQGNRSGNHGTEILNYGDRICKVSASTFAIERKAFKRMYKAKPSERKSFTSKLND